MNKMVYRSFNFDHLIANSKYIINVLYVDSFNVIFTKSLYYRKDSRNDLQLVFKYFRQVKK